MMASRVAQRVLTPHRVTARYLAGAKDINAILLQIRKGTWGPVIKNVASLTEVLEYLGGWKVEPFIAPAHVEFARMFVGPEKDVREVHAVGLKHLVKALPSSPKIDEKYILKLGDVEDVRKRFPGDPPGKEFEVEFQLYVGAQSFRVTAPNGKILELVPDSDAWAQGRSVIDLRAIPKLGKKAVKYIRLYRVPQWLEKETDIKQQVLDRLGMEAHQKGPQRDRVTRDNTGSCPCCFRNIKLKQTTGNALPLMVPHGYQRPGWGYHVGNCYGVNYPPFELSTEGTKHLLTEVLTPRLKGQKEFLERLESGEVNTLHDNLKKIERGDPGWDRFLRNKIAEVKREVDNLERDIDQLSKMVARWKEEPLPEENAPVKAWQLKEDK